jgi:hypothetical protein
MAANKVLPVVKDNNKSSSLAKNYVGGSLNNKPLANNLVGSQNVYGKQPVMDNQRREGYGEKGEQNINSRYNNVTGGVAKK